MKIKSFVLIGLILILTSLVFTVAFAANNRELASVRTATAKFQNTEKAQAAGWDLVAGLDYCFENAGVGAMGFHYINVDLLDTEVDPLLPEALVYEPDSNGQFKLVAVEYIVPAEAWDATGNSELPSLFGHSFHLNEALGVYVLHAWIWKHNPAGIFEDWNPKVFCP